MHAVWQNFRSRQRTAPGGGALLSVAVGVVVLGVTSNVALCSMVRSYARPEMVASGVVSGLQLMRVLFDIWFGIRLLS